MGEAILIIEDDAELGAQITRRLMDSGFAVTLWSLGRKLTPEVTPNVALVVLDLMVPGRFGLDMLKDLRAWSPVPVLVLSARADAADKVRALSLGADDYMTKPFWPDELRERVRARLRRPSLGRREVVELGDLRVDRAAREVTVAGNACELTRAEFELVAMLAERPGEAMTRKALSARALDKERDGGERTLDVHMSRLRKKLGPRGYIETVWGIGYKLTAGTTP